MRRIMQAAGLLLALTLAAGVRRASTQELVTATPIQVNLVTPTPPAAATALLPTATWTATAAALAVLEALDTANVRGAPDINGALLGQIRSGERYTVTGRYFEWYEFQFDRSPNGRGWVFGQLVNIVGDPATIPELTDEPAATVDPLTIGATQTSDALAAVPGGDLTATAAARGVISTLQIPGVIPNGRSTPLPAGTAMPTFTFPPGLSRTETTATPDNTEPAEETLEIAAGTLTNLPPLIPILVLGSLGLVGLVISGRRRR